MEIESGDSPLELAIGREGVERYEQALQSLRPEEREVIIGRIELGYTYEGWLSLGKPIADAARKAAQRALMRLAEESPTVELASKNFFPVEVKNRCQTARACVAIAHTRLRHVAGNLLP